MTAMTEPLDRIAQSHIEGRVERVRAGYTIPANVSKAIKQSYYLPQKRDHICVHCGAEYDTLEGYYPHRYGCPCVHPMQGTTK